jgi:hypothetical protein
MFTLERSASAARQPQVNLAEFGQMGDLFRKPEFATEFRAIGMIRGRLALAQAEDRKGTITTEEGDVFPCFLMPKIAHWLKRQDKAELDRMQCWTVYPQMRRNKPGSRLFLMVKGCRSLSEDYNPDESVDVFSIRGVVVKQDDGIITVRIDRNATPEQKSKQIAHMQPFTLEIEGFLPGEAIGQFWDIDCIREADRLVLDDASRISASLR